MSLHRRRPGRLEEGRRHNILPIRREYGLVVLGGMRLTVNQLDILSSSRVNSSSSMGRVGVKSKILGQA